MRRAALHAAFGTIVAALALTQPSAAWARKATTSASSSYPSYVFTRASSPLRTIVSTADGKWAATFTDRSYTVTLAGPARTFAESTARYPVTTSIWVRELPAPFGGTVDPAWLAAALADRSPDVLAVAAEYLESAPPVYDGELQIAGDASYGPLQADGTRQEGSDFNDYLGVPWTYEGSVDSPEANQLRSLDCSGYVRMVFGYRSGLPLTLSPTGDALPRRSFQILDAAPGVVTIANSGVQATSLRRLAPGDLVFFDADSTDGTQVDHVGVYLGRDTGGNYRFVSSRKSIDGPTMGDYHGSSTLNGVGFYARSFRAARRL